MTEGENAEYFAWSFGEDSEKYSNRQAPDRDEYLLCPFSLLVFDGLMVKEFLIMKQK